jgi:hypothetical protein
LLHWLIFIILLLQGIAKHARNRRAPRPASPYVQMSRGAEPEFCHTSMAELIRRRKILHIDEVRLHEAKASANPVSRL